MNTLWKSTTVCGIGNAVYVAPNTGKHIHRDRPLHGLVLNDGDSVKDYCFDDGRVMRTEGGDLFYLPKGSSYHVKVLRAGGCYAINFDAEVQDEPFCVSLRNTESLLHHFKSATDAWKKGSELKNAAAMRAIYDAIYRMQRELSKQYVSSDQRALIAPAVEMMEHAFTQSDLSVAYLSSLCGVSEVYFRRLFLNFFGVSPKEYLIQKRIAYARSLLASGSFSVSEIAALCGYTEPCHFSREFSRRVGCSPSQYMK